MYYNDNQQDITMNVRIQNLREKLQVDKYPICIERARLMTESYQKTEGRPMILLRAEALAYENIYGRKVVLAVISVSGHWPAGEISGATPHGRYAHEALTRMRP
jgi:pyruvate-formate lyase